MVKLGDICDIKSGGTPSRSNANYWNNGNIPWIKISDFNDTYIENTEEFITKEGLDNSSAKMIKKGSILFTIFATLGEVAILNIDATTNQAIASLTITDESVKQKYLYYFLCSLKDFVNGIGRGVAQNNINLKILKNISVPIPSSDKQNKIIKILDNVNCAIDCKKQQLLKLDELVKSRFIEMFGDPVINPLGWKTSRLGDYMTTLTDFSANGSYKLLDSHVIMYNEPHYAIMVRTTDLETGNLQNGVKYIDQNAYELLSKSKLFGGELIMNKIGSAGKIYLMPHIGVPASLGRNAFMFRFDERLNIVFLYTLLTSEYGIAEIQQHIQGAVTKTITKESTRSIRIIVPPIEKQKQFAVLVDYTNKSKLAIEKSIEKLEILKKSLMQEYFG